MDEAARARSAAREAIDDITPARLRDVIDARLRTAPMTPGVLTRLAARATSQDVDARELDHRTAGVQLIYEGLRLTRSLARSPPWDEGWGGDDADVDIIAADVLVARGFSLLARTEASRTAVETVRAFGRDETNRAAGRPDPELTDRTLEADVFELAVITGVSVAGVEPPAGVRRFAADLAGSFDRDLPAAPELLSEPAVEALASLVTETEPSAATTPDRMWAGSSVTDP